MTPNSEIVYLNPVPHPTPLVFNRVLSEVILITISTNNVSQKKFKKNYTHSLSQHTEEKSTNLDIKRVY